jgi:hypothetical protein
LKKKIQNKIAESRFALPLTVACSLLVWFAAGIFEKHLWAQFICTYFATFLMVEFNNINALIRIYSRMVSCTFLVLVMMASFLLNDFKTGLMAVCVIGFLISFFKCYQNRKATGGIFYAFICLGIASTVWIQIIFFVPILWILMKNNVQCFSIRNLFSSLFGLITPYWFLIGYYAYVGNLGILIKHFKDLALFGSPLHFTMLTNHEVITFTFIIILLLTGTIHYLRNSFDDKIRVRLIFESFILMSIFTLVFFILQPQHFIPLLMILIINTAPLIAHFFALTKTRVTNIAFLLIIFTSLFITVYNLWTPSTIF